MQNKIEINIPFCGFYESIAGSIVDDNLFNGFNDDENIIYPNDLSEEQYKLFDAFCDEHRKEYELDLVNDYLNNLANELDIKFNFTDVLIDSPKQYNYGTDRIFAKVSLDVLLDMYREVDKNILSKTIKDNCTSYDGFISHYENELNAPEWQDPSVFDHNQWAIILEALIDQKNIDVDQCLYN